MNCGVPSLFLGKSVYRRENFPESRVFPGLTSFWQGCIFLRSEMHNCEKQTESILSVRSSLCRIWSVIFLFKICGFLRTQSTF